MGDQRIADFKKDLRTLLEKHDASLGIMVSGDTHGIFEEGIGVQFKLPLAEGANFRGWTDEERLIDGYSLGHKDLD